MARWRQKLLSPPSSPYLVHKLDDDELQNLIEGGHAVNASREVLERQSLVGRRQHNKRIPLAGGILRGEDGREHM